MYHYLFIYLNLVARGNYLFFQSINIDYEIRITSTTNVQPFIATKIK